MLEDDAARLNRAFAIVQTEGRPMVIAKAATSIDSRIAAAPGVRTPLTSREANRRTQRLRASVDAIGVGSGTLLADDPVLTVRDCYRLRPLIRVVFDRRLRTPPWRPAVIDAQCRAGHNNDNGGRDRPAAGSR